MSKILYRGEHEGTLVVLESEISLLKMSKNFFYVIQMFIVSCSSHQNVIYIDAHMWNSLEDVFYCLLEDKWC